VARAIRAFADGFAAVLLARYLKDLGFNNTQIGVLVTATLLGSAVLTLFAGLRLNRWGAQPVLFASCGLMALTGIGFATVTRYVPLVIVGFCGTLNPSAGDVSLFLPTEQAVVADLTETHERPHRFAVYNVGATLAGALGALMSPLPHRIATNNGWDVVTVERLSFLIYLFAAIASALLYRSLRTHAALAAPRRGLHKSRSIVIRLSALFTIDAAGGGFAVTSLLVLYLDVRFGLSPAATGATFAAAGVLTAFSQFLSGKLAARIGLVRTMVFTHLPANMFLILAGIVPNATLAIIFLLLRATLSQMDVPARQALVMRVVEPDERAAAASVTNVPRSLGSALTPALAGLMLEHSTFGWPLIAGGLLKATYDILLLRQPLDRD
jgi:predicted MFS family arabinose efflux permease